jgi:hypothetical protein
LTILFSDVFFLNIYDNQDGGNKMNKSIEVLVFPDGRMDVPNASDYLGLAQKTLAMMRCQGTGPKFIKRGRIFYFKDDLDEWILKEGKLSSTAKGA